MIEITGVNLIKFIRKVYELSIPQGIGILHYKEGILSNEEVISLLHPLNPIIIDMDYVKGRACKMQVFKIKENLFIRDNWYDHTNEQLRELLKHALPNDVKFQVLDCQEHSVVCECIDCQVKRS